LPVALKKWIARLKSAAYFYLKLVRLVQRYLFFQHFDGSIKIFFKILFGLYFGASAQAMPKVFAQLHSIKQVLRSPFNILPFNHAEIKK